MSEKFLVESDGEYKREIEAYDFEDAASRYAVLMWSEFDHPEEFGVTVTRMSPGMELSGVPMEYVVRASTDVHFGVSRVK